MWRNMRRKQPSLLQYLGIDVSVLCQLSHETGLLTSYIHQINIFELNLRILDVSDSERQKTKKAFW